MSTLRAILTGVRGVHRHKLPTGPYCLVRKEAGELAPRHVMDALGETAVVDHPVDRQILDSDQVKGVDDATTMLMREVAPPPGNAFMHPRHDLATLSAFRCILLRFAETPLRLGKGVFVASEETRVGDFLPTRKRGEGLQSYSTAHLAPGRWQWRGLGALARETHVPLARAAPTDRRRLERAIHWAMQENLHLSDAGDANALLLGSKAATDRHLREGDALVASTPTEAGVPRRLTSFHPAEERLKRQIKAYSDILQYLRLDPSQCWTCGLERGQGRLLVIQTQRLLSLLPHFPAFSQQVIVQPAALLTLLVKETLLLLGWVQAVLECLTHVEIIRLRHTLCQARWAIHPPLESRGFLALFCNTWASSVLPNACSSKVIDKTATKLAVWSRWTAPDPRMGAAIELASRHARGEGDLGAIGETLAS